MWRTLRPERADRKASATAPSTPASQDPSRLSTWPWLSGAYQSRVFSAALPSARRRTSLTTVVVTLGSPWSDA
jgi:hypothetical protein